MQEVRGADTKHQEHNSRARMLSMVLTGGGVWQRCLWRPRPWCTRQGTVPSAFTRPAVWRWRAAAALPRWSHTAVVFSGQVRTKPSPSHQLPVADLIALMRRGEADSGASLSQAAARQRWRGWRTVRWASKSTWLHIRRSWSTRRGSKCLMGSWWIWRRGASSAASCWRVSTAACSNRAVGRAAM